MASFLWQPQLQLLPPPLCMAVREWLTLNASRIHIAPLYAIIYATCGGKVAYTNLHHCLCLRFCSTDTQNHLQSWCCTVRMTPNRLSNVCSAPCLVGSSSLRPRVQACVSLFTRVRTLCFHLPDSSYTKVENACVGLDGISVVSCVATTPPLILERLVVALHGRSYQTSAPSRLVIVLLGSPLTAHPSHISSRSVELSKGNYDSELFSGGPA